MKRDNSCTSSRLIIWGLSIVCGVLFSTGCARNAAVTPPVASSPTGPVKEYRPISSGKYRTVVLADVDGDGNIDVIAGGVPPAPFSICYGDGHGKIAETRQLPTNGDVQSAAVADVNNDGLGDVVFSTQGESSGIVLWLNRANREWQRGGGPDTANPYQGIAVADVNGDGNIDIIAANAASETAGGIQVWLGDGLGNWPVQTGPSTVGIYMDVVAADFNEDGHPDIAAGGWGVSGALRVWLGDGTGNWSAAPPVASGSFYGLDAADLDGDGHLDLLAGTYRAGVSVFRGDGRGGFTPMAKPLEQDSFWDVIVTDLDEDGAADLLAASNEAKGISAWRFKDWGRWEAVDDRFPFSGNYYGLAAGDFNGDGYRDVGAASFGEGVKFWHGKTEAAYGPPTAFPAGLSDARTRQPLEAPEENRVYKSVSGFSEYKIDPGDLLEITLWQAAKPSREEVLVRPDGKISFGFVDDLDVRGLTPTQLDERLTRYYRKYVRQPRIDVVVKQYNSKFVMLTGAVATSLRSEATGTGAGRYPLTGKTSLLEMLSRAGGPTRDANLREVRVRRKNGENFALNLYQGIYQGDTAQDIILDDGDLIFIPTLILDANRVYVFGEVEKPGVVKLTEANMDLFDAIAEAGGPTVFAVRQQTRIVRGNVTRPEIIPVDLKKLLEEGDQSQNVALNNGDFIYVPRSFFGDVNIFWQRIRPFYEIIIAPARTVNEWDEAIQTAEPR